MFSVLQRPPQLTCVKPEGIKAGWQGWHHMYRRTYRWGFFSRGREKKEWQGRTSSSLAHLACPAVAPLRPRRVRSSASACHSLRLQGPSPGAPSYLAAGVSLSRRCLTVMICKGETCKLAHERLPSVLSLMRVKRCKTASFTCNTGRNSVCDSRRGTGNNVGVIAGRCIAQSSRLVGEERSEHGRG